MSVTDRLKRQELRHQEQTPVQTAVVATSAGAVDDDVFVTLPYSENPQVREGPVSWSPKPGAGGTRLYPSRGDVGAIFYTEVGIPWLMW